LGEESSTQARRSLNLEETSLKRTRPGEKQGVGNRGHLRVRRIMIEIRRGKDLNFGKRGIPGTRKETGVLSGWPSPGGSAGGGLQRARKQGCGKKVPKLMGAEL